MERVIFRKEYNPYTKKWGYLACFPDDEANAGYIVSVPMYFFGDMAIFENCTELSLKYYYSKKILHKADPDAWKCVDALERRYGCGFKICEKI